MLHHRRRAVPLVAILAAVVCLLTAAPAAAQLSPTLVDTVRAATFELRSPEAAIAAGWAPATGCVSGPQSGAMGVHCINGSLVPDGDLDPEQPEALIFETRGGRTALVGVEFLVIAEQWHARARVAAAAAARAALPSRRRRNRYGLPPFYELHVWAWKENPSGTFTDWHPHVTCDEVTAAEPTSRRIRERPLFREWALAFHHQCPAFSVSLVDLGPQASGSKRIGRSVRRWRRYFVTPMSAIITSSW